MARVVGRMEVTSGTFNILTGKSVGKRSIRRTRVDGKTLFEWILKNRHQNREFD